ncbi:MAG: methyltransferase domain-containing protein, partial [Treponema sp.]|nr:methyltransferase domain-containing protein [Treponema sp.]
MSRGSVLAVPACSPGMGGGHLVRCMALVCGLRALGRDALLFLSDTGADFESIQGILDSVRFGATPFDPAWIAAESGLHDKNWECIVLDRCRTPLEEYRRWAELGPVIAIDEGGPYRDRFGFLLDILPNISRVQPNIADPSLLPLPKKVGPGDSSMGTPPKVLVSFGQEDSAGLGMAAAEALATKAGVNLEITLLKGARNRGPENSGRGNPDNYGKIKTMGAIPRLSERLGEYDLIVTHFGLTAFEALYAGVPVLLVSPTKHHERVARKAGFHSLGIGKGRAKKIAGLLLGKNGVNHAFLDRLKTSCNALAVRHNVDHAPRQSLAELVNGFTPDLGRNCSACGGNHDAPPPTYMARFPERTYRQCKHCGTIVMDRLTPPPIEYGREYFFEFYEKQYGKTYIDDFPNLTAMGKRRLASIAPLLPGNAGKPLLLDIGCAYGPFLAAARDEGFSPHGIDPSADAVDYVTQTLGIQAVQGFFPCGSGEQSREYDAVTLWYVIEHFRDCVAVLTEIRKIL